MAATTTSQSAVRTMRSIRWACLADAGTNTRHRHYPRASALVSQQQARTMSVRSFTRCQTGRCSISLHAGIAQDCLLASAHLYATTNARAAQRTIHAATCMSSKSHRWACALQECPVDFPLSSIAAPAPYDNPGNAYLLPEGSESQGGDDGGLSAGGSDDYADYIAENIVEKYARVSHAQTSLDSCGCQHWFNPCTIPG